EDADELVPEPVLEGDALRIDPARHEQHLLVFDIDALDRADTLGKLEHLRLAERRRGVPAAILLPDHRRIETLLDRGPDAEGWRKDLVARLVAHDQVGAVARAQLVDLAEQVVRRIARKHVAESRLHAHPDEREASRA